MTKDPGTRTARGSDDCLARSVISALAEDPALEAVTIDRARRTISVATLGKVDVDSVEARINRTISGAQASEQEHRCQLLAGEGDCLGCVRPIDELQRQRITIRHEADSTTIARVTCPTAPKFWRWRDLPFPKIVQRDVEFLEDEHDVDEWKPQLAAAVLCGVSGLAGYFLKDPAWSVGAYVAAYLAGSWFTAQEVWERLRQRAIDVHFLMLAVAAGSASIGAWGEGAMLLFLFSFSGALEHYALGRTQKEIRSLFREAPKSATVIEYGGQEREVPVERLRAGMRLKILPGAQFPVDAEVASGRTAADESNLTGEAAPVEKGIGDMVLAGTMNLWGAVQAVVIRPAAESSLQKIIRLIKEAQHQKAPAQQFTDKFSAIYTYVVLGLSAIMFFVWWQVFGLAPFAAHDAGMSAFYRTMTLLVVASPCALVLSIPSAVLAAIAWGARHGILFRGGAAVEKLAGITTVALDKTGTLTTGELRVEKVESFPPGNELEVARVAYSLERLSAHPLAWAITRYGKQQGLEAMELHGFESVTGKGLRGQRNGKECQLGRREWLIESANFAQPGERLLTSSPTGTGERLLTSSPTGAGERLLTSSPTGAGERLLTSSPTGREGLMAQVPPTEAGSSEIWIREGDLFGRIVLRDDIRPQARQVIEDLRAAGLHCVVLTGDRKGAAEHLKAELAIDDVRAELHPEEKLSEIRNLTAAGKRVAMVGDGVNDAPSLAASHIGVAMGARGSDAALEQADIVLMHDRLENFLAAFRLSQRARRIIRQNLLISLGTVIVLVTFAMIGKIPLTIGVVGHEGSTVIVVMNSLRLLFTRSAGRG